MSTGLSTSSSQDRRKIIAREQLRARPGREGYLQMTNANEVGIGWDALANGVASSRGNKHVTHRTRLAVLLLCVMIVLSSMLSQQVGFVGSIFTGQNRSRSVHEVFSRCRDTNDGASNAEQLPYPYCSYFRPSLYFLDPSQPGYQYKDLIDRAASDIRLSMWGKEVSDFNDKASKPNSFLLQQGIGSVSSILIPKVGSRTIDALFLERLSLPLDNKKKNVGPRVGSATRSHWKKVADRQRKTALSEDQHTDIVFALLRDPIARFFSSLAQVLTPIMQTKYAKCAQVLQPCLEESKDFSSLVRCVIDSMKDPAIGYFDVHLAPQAVFLSACPAGNDVHVAMFSMEQEGPQSLSDAFGATNTQKNKRESKVYPRDVMDRFGTELLDPEKARSAVQKDGSILRDICDLYAVDVGLMRYLGFAVNDCDAAIASSSRA